MALVYIITSIFFYTCIQEDG